MVRVLVLGAGVLGSTVAITLQLTGHSVFVVAEKFIDDPDAQSDPLFASAYPAASIIPHSASSDSLSQLLEASNTVFNGLAQSTITGVRLQRHFELFEAPSLLPSYSSDLLNLREHPVNDPSIPIKRGGSHEVSGISFDCFFCDMPIYGRWLSSSLRQLGISLQRRSVDRAWLESLKEVDVVVDCLGAGARGVFDDLSEGTFYRGVLLLCPYPEDDHPKVSYNYTPSYDIYPGFGGSSADVYFYPRHGHCVLGGSRQPGRVDRRTNTFIPLERYECELVSIGGISVPKPIIDLNRELVRQLTNERLVGPLRPLVGYRYIAEQASHPSAIIEVTERTEMPLGIDCIGFGGAGVTLSWGAALKVATLTNMVEPTSALALAEKLRKLLLDQGQHCGNVTTAKGPE